MSSLTKLLAIVLVSAIARGTTAGEREINYASDVQPILARHCYSCHGPDKRESQFRLDVKAAAIEGGDLGEPPIVPGNSAASPLIKYVAGLDENIVMPPEGERLASAQIDVLRAWIDQGAVWPDDDPAAASKQKLTSDHWSFQPLAHVLPPVVEDAGWGSSGIDAFIFQKLQAAGLKPSPPADRVTLVRRLYLVMHGLPPTPEQVRAFVDDPRPDAYERLVDLLLASPRYGERWAQHWLDVVRFADTHGFEVNSPRPNAWPYRDWVIRALNDDKPYDEYVFEQLAGDSAGEDAAGGFLVAAPALLRGQIGKDEASIKQARQDELNEIIVGTSGSFLGLTVGCARCHNHKFDPILQQDYYSMQAVFAGVHYGERPWRSAERNGEDQPKVFAGTFATPEPTRRLYRGDPSTPREVVAPDTLGVLGTLGLAIDAPEQQRRIALARWIAGRDNPLTARVMVNRIWHYHFGMGIVDTPSDFGAAGSRPSHPELLDWLAGEFIRGGWSIKQLHRQILHSSTYRQSHAPHREAQAVDAGTRLLWRYPLRRLEAEPIRDSVLAVSGILDLSMGGPGFGLFEPNTNYVRVYNPKKEFGPADWRRMIYAEKVRMEQDAIFGALDCPDAGQVCPKRSRSTTALQAANLLNSHFMIQQAEVFAKRLEREAGSPPAEQVDRGFLLTLGRLPDAEEQQAANHLIAEHGLAAFCRAILNTSEFLFIP